MTEWRMEHWRIVGERYRAEISGVADLSKISDEHVQLIAQAIRDFRDSKEDHMEHVGLIMSGEPALGVMQPNRKAYVAPRKETIDG